MPKDFISLNLYRILNMSKISKIILLLVLLYTNVSFATTANDNIKLILLQRIAQYIQWPELPNKEFTIGVLDNNSLKEQMNELYEDSTIHNLPINIVNITKESSLFDLDKVDILYLTIEKSQKIDNILNVLNKKATLLVTEFPDDVYNNMHLAFYYDKNKKIKFLINQEALEENDLKASYKLLRLAKIVERKEND